MNTLESSLTIAHLLPQQKEQKKSLAVKLEWVFGIRRDITPNIFLLDNDTLVYPAGHNIVIFNHPQNLHYNQIQQFIHGSPHSQGITAIAVSCSHKKFVAFAEEISDGACVHLYSIISVHGIKNFPNKICTLPLHENSITKVYDIYFSQVEKGNSYFALIGLSDEPCLVLWRWDMEVLKENPAVFPLKFPTNAYNFLKVSFSSTDNESIVIVSDSFFIFYSILRRNFEEVERYNLNRQSELGNVFLSHCWLEDGNFCIASDEVIIIIEAKTKTIIQKIINFDSAFTVVARYNPCQFDGFIACGKSRKMDFYEKKGDLYEKVSEKKNYEFAYNLNEKFTGNFDKVNQNDKTGSSDRERIFDFHSIVGSIEDQFVIATTSNNDLMMINTTFKDIEKVPVTHLISPFHCDSVEGMDICINKPYIITCSPDKSIRLWDYKRRSLVYSKTYEEELYSIAYHPSGMHALASSEDKIFPLNIYYDEIGYMTLTPIPSKAKPKDVNIYFNIIFCMRRLNFQIKATFSHLMQALLSKFGTF